MTVIRKTLAEIEAHPYSMTDEERQRILSMTEEQIEAVALADPDNPPWTDEELAEARRERDERLAAERRRRDFLARPLLAVIEAKYGLGIIISFRSDILPEIEHMSA